MERAIQESVEAVLLVLGGDPPDADAFVRAVASVYRQGQQDAMRIMCPRCPTLGRHL